MSVKIPRGKKKENRKNKSQKYLGHHSEKQFSRQLKKDLYGMGHNKEDEEHLKFYL